MDERLYLKVKIKSLAAEAKIIREETKKAKVVSIKDGLYRHRIDVVRVEARHTHLAYGFLRGKTYGQIEQTAREVPNWPKVRKMVEKYCSHFVSYAYAQGIAKHETYAEYEQRVTEHKTRKEETLKRFDEWVEQAKTSDVSGQN